MKAYNNDPQLKEDLLTEMRWHLEQDKILQGKYSEDGQFCAVGCAIESLNKKKGLELSHEDHSELAAQLDIPETIPHLIDRFFEGLEKEKAPEFAIAAFDAITVGADLSMVTPKLMVWLLEDVKQYAKDEPDVLAAIDTVIGLYIRVLTREAVSDDEWARAARAAWAAWAAEAAWAAAGAAAWAAADVAWAESYERMSDKLLELLREAT